MQRYNTLLLLALTFWLPFIQLTGQPVSATMAKGVAVRFLNEQGFSQVNPELLVHSLIKESEEPALHIIQSAHGFVIVPADATLYPVLGFAKGLYSQVSQQPEIGFWIRMYSSQMLSNIENKSEAPVSVKAAWSEYLGHSKPLKNQKQVVDPMLFTAWNQGCYYNSALPPEPAGPCGHLFTGCVATALAQILKHYNYPKQGTGSHSLNTSYGVVEANFGNTPYAWTDMELNLSDENPAVAELMMHCVVAVNSQFFPNGTGAYDIDARHALVNYFGFHSGAQFRLRDNYGGDWNTLIRSELESGRPVIYGGVEQASMAGHTFIVDGFQEPAFFHINWGWGGQYNGYFYLDSLIAGNYHFDYFHDVITGIRPDIDTNQVLYPPENLNVTVSGQSVTLTWSEAAMQGSLELIGYNIFRDKQIINQSIVTGLQFTDEPVPPSDHTYYVHSVFIGNNRGPYAFTPAYVSGMNEHKMSAVNIFPNPAKGEFTIEFAYELTSLPDITIYNGNGEYVAFVMKVTGSNSISIKMAEQRRGIFLIRSGNQFEAWAQKIVLH